MRTLIDKENNLEWITFDRTESEYFDKYKDYINQINTWSDNEDMKKFISEDPIGNEMNFLFQMVDDSDLYLAIKDNEVISAVILGHTRPLAREIEIINYAKEKRYLKKSMFENNINEEYLDQSRTEELIRDRYKDNIYIEYLLVNPKYYGRGIATRFYKFLIDNLEFFNGKNVEILQASIKEENIGSRKAILKNGFRRLKPVYEIPTYSTYYLHLRPNDNLKDNINHEKL